MSIEAEDIIALFEAAGCPEYTVYSSIMGPVTVFPECSTVPNLRFALKDSFTEAVSFKIGDFEQTFYLREKSFGVALH